ncbi:MAG: hypothetical protein JNL72_07595 [Flavipsychrobacter sp.]|nr:hypothetical protein [Flavipsychrobacter sp.]
MKGVTFVMDDNDRRVAVQIDMKTLIARQEEIEDLLDVIVAESREEDEDISWDDAKNELRKSGML